MIKIRKDIVLKMAIIFRQIYLSTYRAENDAVSFQLFFEKNIDYIKELLSEIEIDYFSTGFSSNRRKKLFFVFRRKLLSKTFENEDLYSIRNNLKNFIKKLETPNLTKDEELINLGKEAEKIYWNVLIKKTKKSERKKISLIEHFGQNNLVDHSYYNISELYTIFNLKN